MRQDKQKQGVEPHPNPSKKLTSVASPITNLSCHPSLHLPQLAHALLLPIAAGLALQLPLALSLVHQLYLHPPPRLCLQSLIPETPLPASTYMSPQLALLLLATFYRPGQFSAHSGGGSASMADRGARLARGGRGDEHVTSQTGGRLWVRRCAGRE